jgi:hypothetical protein
MLSLLPRREAKAYIPISLSLKKKSICPIKASLIISLASGGKYIS